MNSRPSLRDYAIGIGFLLFLILGSAEWVTI
jgi:hypothetical protein